MKPLIPLLIAFTISAAAQDQSATEAEKKGKAESNELDTIPVAEGFTIPNCLKLQWKDQDKSKLPTALLIINPFLEEIEVLKGPSKWEYDIEYFDPYLASWRTNLGLAGTFGGENVRIKYGESSRLIFPELFWHFLTDSVPRLTAEKSTRVRLALDMGGVVLRSSEFIWNTSEPQR